MNICITCGQVRNSGARAAPALRSSWTQELEEDHRHKCLCWMSVANLTSLLEPLEKKFKDRVNKFLPGGAKNLHEIQQKLGEMGVERNNPLRVELSQRLNYISRLKKEILARRVTEAAKADFIEHDLEKVEERVLHGKPVSLSEWLNGQGHDRRGEYESKS